jgi:hypothetical protein
LNPKGTFKTLQNVINNLILETLDAAGLTAIVDELQMRKLIVVNNGNIKYTPPSRESKLRRQASCLQCVNSGDNRDKTPSADCLARLCRL